MAANKSRFMMILRAQLELKIHEPPADGLDLIYLKFYIFLPQICFVVNRRGTPGHLRDRLQVHSMQR